MQRFYNHKTATTDTILYLTKNTFTNSINFLFHLTATISIIPSVTRKGDFLDFGQLFKAFGNN